MKLLYCIPALHNTGGMERVLTEKVNFLAALPNYDITIVTTDHSENQPIRFPLDERIKVIHLPLNYIDHFKFSLPKKYIAHQRLQRIYKRKLQALIETLKIDICISLCGKEIEFLGKMQVPCKKVAEIHFAMNIRAQFLSARHNSFLWRIIGKWRTHQLIKSVKKMDKFVVLTNYDKQQWLAAGCKNVQTIHNPNALHSPKQSNLQTKRVIAVGRLEPQKGYDMLIETWKTVVENMPNWQLSIFGNGEDFEKLSAQIRSNNLGKSVTLHGNSDNIENEYVASSVLVMSSRFEGLPMVLIEGMSCGLPAVSFDCEHGPRELITNGFNGFLVELNNTAALAEKLVEMMENFELRQALGSNARKFSEQFATPIIMQNWTKLFAELMKEK